MANGRKNRNSSPAGVLMALLILLLMVISVIVILRSCSGDGAEVTPTPSAADTQTPLPETQTPGETPTTAPTQSPEPTPTATPDETATPEPTAIPPASATGSIRSDTGTDLNLVADWQAYSAGDDNITLAITLCAESYSLTCRAIPDGATLTINGTDIVFDTAAVDYSGSELHKSELGSVSVTMPLGEDGTLTVPISAQWGFSGSYSGTDFDTLSAEGTAQIG